MLGKHLAGSSRALMHGTLAAAMLLVGVSPAAAQSDLSRETSLGLVPAEAAYYATSLHLKEQLDAVRNSAAFQKLKTSFLYQMAQSQLQMAWQSSDVELVRRLRNALEEPENQELLEVLGDAMSRETFLYAGPGMTDALLLATELSQAMNRAQIEALREGREADEELIGSVVLEQMERHGQTLQFPELVIGFRVTDPAAVWRQVDRLEQWVRSALEADANLQQLAERMSRQEWDDAQLVVLELQGKDIPWEEAAEQLDDSRQQDVLRRVRQVVEPLSGTLAVGMVRDYLLLSIGPDLTHLQRLGQETPIWEHPRLAALRDHADQRIVSVRYTSQELTEVALQNARRQAEQTVQMMVAAMLHSEEIPEHLREEIREDAQKAAELWKSYIPRGGAQLAFSYLTETGYEGYQYQWTENLVYDGSQQLSLLERAGPRPLFFTAARGKSTGKEMEAVAYAVRRADYYAREMLKTRAAEQLERYTEARELFLPLLKQARDVFEEKLGPAFAAGESAVVIDVGAESSQWHAALPASDSPLPMIRPAVVCAVSDRQLAREGFEQLFRITQRAWLEGRQHWPEAQQVPLERIPEPDVQQHDGHELFVYEVPWQVGEGADRLAPNMGLSDQAMVLSLFPAHTLELLESHAPSLPAEWSATDRPLAAASHLDWAGWVEAAEQWIGYGVSQWQASNQAQDNPMLQMGLAQMDILTGVLKSFKGYSSITYLEDDALVKRYRTEFQDLDGE